MKITELLKQKMDDYYKSYDMNLFKQILDAISWHDMYVVVAQTRMHTESLYTSDGAKSKLSQKILTKVIKRDDPFWDKIGIDPKHCIIEFENEEMIKRKFFLSQD